MDRQQHSPLCGRELICWQTLPSTASSLGRMTTGWSTCALVATGGGSMSRPYRLGRRHQQPQQRAICFMTRSITGASIYDGAAWQPVNAVVRVPSVKRTPPGTGDLWLDTSGPTATVNVYDGAGWNPMGGSPIGSIIMYPNITPPAGYLLCDGSTIDATAHPRLAALFSGAGGKLPDLTDQFVRGASSNADVTGSIKHNDTTRRPRQSAFTGNTSEHMGHHHTASSMNPAVTRFL